MSRRRRDGRSAPAAALLHTRPRSWPIVAAHLAAGFLVAAGVPGTAGGVHWWGAALLIAAGLWAVCLNGGTLALNGAVDRDEEDVGYLDSPPPPPRGLGAFGVGLMGAGLLLAVLAARTGLVGGSFPHLYGICVVLSVLYSVPPVRLKARAGWDLLVNCLGYGVLTFLAGAAAAAVIDPAARPAGRGAGALAWTPAPVVGWAAAAFGCLVGALYPLTQIYQMEDDRRQGVRTLALVLGQRRSLRLTAVATAAAFVCLAAATALRVVDPLGGLWRGVLLLAPLTLWARVLLPRLRDGAAACGKEDMYAALRAWAVTDVAAVVTLMPFR